MNASERCRVLIVEDEPLAARGLADWVQASPRLEAAGLCGDGLGALAAIRERQPELVLMDIHMPGASGLEVVRALVAERFTPMPLVIFTTAYDEHAITAFELHAVDYLLKPFTRERFDEAINHALSLLERAGEGTERALAALGTSVGAAPLTRVLVRDRQAIVPIAVADIEHLKSDTKYTAITARGRSYLVRLPIASFEQRLGGDRFLKVNRSCIVNLDFVDGMTPDDSSQFVIRLRDGSSVTASREVSKHLRTVVL
jgi:two-component system, LytTR family, response regulator